jgi:hypothetical protein
MSNNKFEFLIKGFRFLTLCWHCCELHLKVITKSTPLFNCGGHIELTTLISYVKCEINTFFTLWLGLFSLTPLEIIKGGNHNLLPNFHSLAPCFFSYILFPCLLQTTILPLLLTNFLPCFLGYILFPSILLQTIILPFLQTTFFFWLYPFPMYAIHNYLTYSYNNYPTFQPNNFLPRFLGYTFFPCLV